MLQTKEEIKAWLDEMGITNYKINKNLTVDVNGDALLVSKNLYELPIQFGIVNGHFSVGYNHLKSLKGSPIKVKGTFDCAYNQLESLEYCPKKIGELFAFQHNNITSLKYCPNSVGLFAVYDKEIQNFNEFTVQVKKLFIHDCKTKENFIPGLEELYEYNAKNIYPYRIKLTAKQFKSALLKINLGLEMTQILDKPKKKIKI